MKYILAALFIWSINLHAQDECASAWVFKPYKICADRANGLDMSAPPESSVIVNIWSDWVKGGSDKHKVCTDLLADFNARSMTAHSIATLKDPLPVDETKDNRIVVMGYRYACQFEVRKYPFKVAANPACGLEDKYSYKIGGSAKDVPGEGSCLSCDNLASQTPEEMVECLHGNIASIIYPNAVELRDPDIQAVVNQVQRVLRLSREVQIKNLESTDQLSFFTDFLDKARNKSGPIGGPHLRTLQ